MALSKLHKGWAYKKGPGILAAIYNEQAFAGAVAHGANSDLEGVLLGTPVTPALAVDSMVLSNLVASGDILIAANNGGNSQAWLWVDSSAGTMTLYAAGVEQLRTALGAFVINEGSADINFRVETDGIQYAIYSDGGKNALVLGSNTDTSSADQLITVSRAARTATANTSYYDLALQPAGAVTVPSGTTAVVATLQVAEPNITATGTVTNAVSAYIASQPTEGTTNAGFGLADNVFLALGTNSDQILANNSAGLGATTAWTGAIVGTPVTPAIAANSLVISNTTASGDVLLAVNLSGNSQAYLWVDSSASLMKLYAAGVEAVNFGVGVTTFNLAQGDIDFLIRGNGGGAGSDIIFRADAGLGAIGLGQTANAGSLLTLGGDINSKAYATSVGFTINLATATLTSTNANPTTLAIGAVVAINTQTYAGANASQTVSDAATFYIANAPQAGTNMTLTRAWALWIDVGNARFDGDVNMAATASDLVIIANTAAAIEISDATTKLYTIDTRNTVTVQNHLFDMPASQTLPDGATSQYRGVSIAAHTVTLAGQTQVTTVNQGAGLWIGAPTYAQSGGAVTVDQVSTLHVATAVAGASVTITANRMISTGVADCYLTGAGVWTDTACTAKYKQDIHDLDMADMPGLLEQIRPVAFKYDPEKRHENDFDRQRYGVLAEDLPDFLRPPGEKSKSALNGTVLGAFGLAAIRYLYEQNRVMAAKLASLGV